MITVEEIQRANFSRSIRGVNEAQVFSFLDRIAGDFKALKEENKTLQASNEALEKELARFRQIERGLSLALADANQAKSDIEKKAIDKANELLAKTNLEVEQNKEENVKYIRKLNAVVNKISSHKVDILNKLSTFLNDQVSALEEFKKVKMDEKYVDSLEELLPKEDYKKEDDVSKLDSSKSKSHLKVADIKKQDSSKSKSHLKVVDIEEYLKNLQ